MSHRKTYEIALELLIYDKKYKKLKPKTIGVINRLSATNIRLIQSPVWFNSSSTPTNYVDIGLCGFDLRDSKPSSKGRLVLALISIAALVVSVIASYMSTKYYNSPIICEDRQVVGSVSDILYLLFFPAQLAQYLSLVSNRGILQSFLKNSIFLFAGDLFGFLGADFDLFWTLYLILLLYSFLISLLSALFAYFWKSLDELKSCSQRALIFVIEHFIPALVNLLYMPTILMLLNIFECTESTGELLTESYLQKDCTKSCYTGVHMKFAIGGGFMLITYISVCS